MATVDYIREERDGRVRVGITLDEKKKELSIPTSLYLSLSFVNGSEIGDGELFVMLRADEEYRAMRKALSILGYSDKNSRTLYLRLLHEGFSGEVSREVVERCVALGYIKERDQLQRCIIREARINLRGPRYIRDKLAAKGYSRADIDEVMELLVADGEINFSECFERLAEKRGTITDEQRRALAYKYGYDYE